MSDIPRILGYYWSPQPDTADDDLVRQADLIGATGANAVYVSGKFLERIPIARLQAAGIRLIADWSVFVGEELRQRFGDSVPVDAAGQPYGRNDWYVPVCPNHPQVRRWHAEGIARLLDGYGDLLFGLWLDFIRFPVFWEGAAPRLPQLCFCRHCLNLFLDEQREHYSQEETRSLAQSILAERHAEWVEWKCERIEAFTQEVRGLVAARGLALRLGIFSLPWRQGDFDGALRAVAGQDLSRLARHVDIFSPMVYHRLCHQDVPWIAGVIGDAQTWSQRTVLPIVQAMDKPDRLAPHELEAALAASLATDAAGVMVFTLDAVQESPAKLAAVRRQFVGRAFQEKRV